MLQRRSSFLIALMAIVVSALIALPALAESNVRIVRLSYIDGDAQINTSNQDNGFTHAILNTPVTAGMWVYTPNNGHAEIQFENGSTVRLADDAQVQFAKLALSDSGGKIDVVSVDHGVVYFDFDKVAKDDNILIKVAGRTFRVEKPSHLRVNAGDKQLVVSVFKGETKALDDGKQIKADESFTVAMAKPDDVKVAKGVDKLGSDDWNKDRANETLIASNHDSPYRYPDPYAAQFSYLGAYGNYFMVPGYGYVWQPTGMGMGWDPFMNGVWGFYPGMGYMWISSYPWGWGPYRYGSWNYMPTYGWVWAPGSTFTSFNVGPRYGTVPVGYRAPVAPAVALNTRPLSTVVVGHPPSVHPAVLAGHAQVQGHAFTTHAYPAPSRVVPNGGMRQAGAMGPGRPANAGMNRPNNGGMSRPSGGMRSGGMSEGGFHGGGMPSPAPAGNGRPK